MRRISPHCLQRRTSSFFSRISQAGAQALANLKHAHDTQLAMPPTHLPLLSFASQADLDRWTLLTDAGIGGFSESRMERSSASSALWAGRLALESDPLRQSQLKSDQGREASKVGFCAIRTAVSNEAWSLHDYHGLCVRMRPDARRYIINVRADSVLSENRMDDLYQAQIVPALMVQERPPSSPIGSDGDSVDDAADFVNVRIPWGAFTLTWRGNVQGTRPPPMNLDKITHLGFLLADESPGAFACDFAAISAFRYEEDEFKFDPRVREAMRANEDMGYADVLDG